MEISRAGISVGMSAMGSSPIQGSSYIFFIGYSVLCFIIYEYSVREARVFFFERTFDLSDIYLNFNNYFSNLNS